MRWVTAAEMREIDRRAIEDYGIPSLLLMENAGIACAQETVRLLGSRKGPIAIFSGKGNNGGDGFVAARHLFNCGFEIAVFFFQTADEMKPDPRVNFEILKKMKVPLVDYSSQVDSEKLEEALFASRLLIDALFGTGLSKPIEEPFKTIIQRMNNSKVLTLSVDVPSGLNSDTGEVMGVCVKAKRTVTLGLPKKGFLLGEASRYIGKVVVADISIPGVLLR